MPQDIDLNLPDKLEFRVNHEKWSIESSNPDIWLHYRGGTPEPYTYFFTLHWSNRAIPVRVKKDEQTFGRNKDGQWIKEVHWTIEQIGQLDFAARKLEPSYEFQSQEEFICAANLILKALRVYGGAVNKPEWHFFPEYRKITSELTDTLKAYIYGGIN
jgi:hypothetical protein